MMAQLLPGHMALTSDFTAWQIRNPKKIKCNGQSVTEDGRLIFNLSINDTEFRLLCPLNYPNHEDSFFIETECTDFWCIALNEFIIDSPVKLTLDVILAKAFLYYTPSSTKSYESSENESENENEDGDCSSVDSKSSQADEWESIISKKKREWREKEGELRLKYNRPKISDMFAGKIIDHPQQVFSNSAASEILINDLINIMGNKASSGIVVDTVDNDICRWSVLLKDFHPHSKISQDLKIIEELYGYDHVQLQLDFAMDLYPSHSPVIRFIKPKLLNVFDAKDNVKLANWNPARDMMSVLKEIKDYIDYKGRIDIDNKHNGIQTGTVKRILLELADALNEEAEYDAFYSSESNYSHKCLGGTKDSPLLRRKNAVIETILTTFLYHLKNSICRESSLPRCIVSNSPQTDSYFIFNLASHNNIFDKKNYEVRSSKTSSYFSSTFKVIDRLMENERPKTRSHYANLQNVYIPCDRKQCNIITNPAFGLGFRSQYSAELQTKKYAITNVLIQQTNGVSNHANKNYRNKSNCSKRGNETNFEYVNQNVVSSFHTNITTQTGVSMTGPNNSTLELNDNFSCIFKALEDSVLLPFIRSKLAENAFFIIWLATTLYSKIIEIIIEFASHRYLIDLLTISNLPDRSIADLLKIQGKNATQILKMLTAIANGCPIKQADLDKAELAKNIIDASKLIESILTKHRSREHSDKVLSISINQIPDSDPDSGQVKSINSVYKDSLKDLKLCNYNIDLETHTFKNNYIANMNSSRNYFRMAQDFTDMSKSLPLELSSAIFVQIDVSKPSLMRALIMGVEGTCCSGGCFSFDIYLGENYPDDELEINCTTFHHVESTSWNLNDHMAFSLSGIDVSRPDSKPWTQFSNLLQVLTFIQSQKLIPLEVYGENQKNGALEESRSKQIFLTNVIRFAMINQMRKPTPGFEEVIVTHFRIKKDRILSELEQYDFLKNSELLDSLKKEFDRLINSQKTSIDVE